MKEYEVLTPHGRASAVDYGGDGPDLLLLHGAGRTLGDWGLVLPHLRGRRVVAMDFRWHGRSSDEGDAGLEANADDVEAVVAELGLHNPSVAGHSLGGMTAVVYGTRHPECPGVANLDGHGLGTPEEYEGITRDRCEAYLNRLFQLSVAPATAPLSGDDAWRAATIAEWGRIAAAYNWTFPPEVGAAADTRSFLRDSTGTWHLRPHPSYRERLAPALRSLRMFEIYGQCRCPLLIYRCSRMLPDPDPESVEMLAAREAGLGRMLEALAAHAPTIRVRTLDTTHFMIFDVPEQVAEDLLRFS